ncbi:hypothetical protein QBC32DRAFT_335932 [Pseudoneurospora amorphoporcata]|uniref:Uncharacterized protein n=1 Tax=Pseudoneurospora amorphoporcata TaxID=241081 RepID=A0AAN6SIT4_9PEZI|nr:hypothetical protein QBC32DRAFT_335932 [Pseudoneurospora amorphoporcata]
MASSSATPQASVTKESFVRDPRGVCEDLSASVRNIGAKFEDGSDRRMDFDEAADTLEYASKMEWAVFCENQDNVNRITSMASAADGISRAGKAILNS